MKKRGKGSQQNVQGKVVKAKEGSKLQEVSETAQHQPLIVSNASSSETGVRRNLAANIVRTDRFKNIEDGLIPFKYGDIPHARGNINIRDVVILCQKAYYNFAIFRNTIDLMTEFSVSDIFFKGGSKKSKDFFRALWSKNNIHGLQDRFYREYYRSGNVFIYKYDGEVQQEDLDKIAQTFGTEITEASSTKTLPVRYIILNPADVQVGGTIAFSSSNFYKLLSDYELEQLRSPRTDEDREVFNSLPPDIQTQIKRRGNLGVLLPLDMSRVTAVFYKKQDYEPFAVPMGFPVLDDINFKAELKKMDMAIMRTMQQCILLITLGESTKDGGMGVNQKHLEAMQRFFENESVARVLIADFTTKAAFVTPDVADLLDPQKYEQVDKDIREGLNNVLIGGDSDKFATASVKVDIFVERLRQARQVFLNEFLIPQIKSIAKNIGLKNYPTPYFEDIDLKDTLQYSQLYTRMMEIGVLTPEEAFEAINSGKLPTPEEAIPHQEEYRKLRDKGYYEPLMGGPFSQQQVQKQTFKSQQTLQENQQEHDLKVKTKELKHQAENPPAPSPQIHFNAKPMAGPVGRPGGTKSTNKPKKVTRVGGEEYSLANIKNNLFLSQKLHSEIEKNLLKKFKVKELSAEQKEVGEDVAEVIIANESPTEWSLKISEYFDNPLDRNPERIAEIHNIACEHQIDTFLASILYWSKK